MNVSAAIIGLHSKPFITSLLSEIEGDPGNPAYAVDLTAIFDNDESKLLSGQKEYGIKKLYTDPNDLLLTEKPDFIIISLPLDEILAVIQFSIEAGIRGIILENPFAATLETAQKIVDLCRLNRINLIIHYPRRWDNLYRDVKAIIDGNHLGSLKMISAILQTNALRTGDPVEIIDQFGGGELLYSGSELVDLIRYFSGEVSAINSTLQKRVPNAGTETGSHSLLHMHSGIINSVSTDSVSQYTVFELDIQLQRGRIIVGKDTKQIYVIEPVPSENGGFELVPGQFSDFIQMNRETDGAVSEMLRTLDNSNLPESSGINALKNMEIAFGIYYSAYLGGNTITLPLKIAGNPLRKMFQSGMI